ncbi:MAG: hypothetical protein R3219_00630 [Hydrogenovibrio sp.]|nr:hypothetical protein [Hydrogenovibrio sp.]
MDTGYWIEDDTIWGPKASGEFHIQDGYIVGPYNSGIWWIENHRIWGPGEAGEFRIENGQIFGPSDELPWLNKQSGA